jgi:hypothetical protein
VIKAVHVPAELVHASDHLIEPVHALEQAENVISGLMQHHFRIGRRDPVSIHPDEEELAFDAEIESQSEARRTLELALENRARAHGPGFTMQAKVARHPGHLGPPRKLSDCAWIREERQFVVMGVLAQTVQCGPGEQL